MKHAPRKRFSQNFLVDDGAIAAIVAAVAPRPGEPLVEIGPGLGALTAPLLAAAGRLHVIEIDRDIVARLRRAYPADRLIVHEGDALEFDFAALGPGLRVVGNLPYHISTPLLFRLADCADALADIHVMLQREVVGRMTAAPGDTEYGRLSVMLQYRFALQKLLQVPAQAFDPVPKVDSAVVRLQPLRPLPHPAQDAALFARVVTAAFGQRRKVLRNSLAAYLDAADFERLGLDPGRRAQELGVAEFVRLADAAARRR
jgi:16S rRNA (adenine1518-N6/adenine1519-N6)-dimethyltransferase